MDKLEKYLDKIGLEYDPAAYGNDYFYNVAPVKFPAAVIEYENRDPETIKKVMKLAKYAARFGYTIFHEGGYPGYNYFHIMKTADKKALEFINSFSEKAQNEAAEMIHLKRTGAGFSEMTDTEFNDYIRGIMDYYGELYKIEKEYPANAA